MPPTGGVNLGTATGTVVITANTAQATAQMQAFAGQMTGIANTLKGVLGAVGVDISVRGAVELGKAVIASTQLATAYERQRVAATNLAGSQTQLNDLLAVYDKATGGILDKSTELANVTQLMSVGFADSTVELEQFATAIRGISIATGRSADTITQNLILELFSQRGMRLDQLGLQYDKVRQRQEALMQSDAALTKQTAYQQAVLAEAQQKFGALATSAAGAATGIEKAGTAWTNFKLKVGQTTKDDVNEIANWFANAIDAMGQFIDEAKKTDEEYQKVTADIRNTNQEQGGFWGQLLNRTLLAPPGQFGQNITGPQFRGQVPSWMTSATGNANPTARIPPVPPEFSEEATNAIVEHAHKQLQLTQETNRQLDDENTSYQQNRLRSQQNYDEQVTRAAADFAKQQVRQEEDYQQSVAMVRREAAQRDAMAARDHDQQIARMQRDSADQLARLAEDRDRTIATRRADFAERIGKLQIEHDKDINQKQEDSQKRLLDINQDFNRAREQAQLSHQDTLSNAAARLDANAVFEENRRFKHEQDAAQQSHDDKVNDEKDKLQESIDNANAAYSQKVADEKTALDQSISQANDNYTRQADDQKAALQQRIDDANTAYQQQLSDAHDADNQRLSDMADNFTEQKKRQGDDQTDRMNQMATDHANELDQLDTEHDNRITQIQTHAGEELTALNTAFNDQMTQLGGQNEDWKTAQDAFQTFALNSYKDHLHDMETEGINAQIRELKSALQNPLLDPDQIQNINNAITALGQALAQIPARTGTGNERNTPRIIDAGVSDIISGAGFTSALPVSAGISSMGSVSMGNVTVVIGDIGNRSDSDVKQLVGDALLSWLQGVARYGASGR